MNKIDEAFAANVKKEIHALSAAANRCGWAESLFRKYPTIENADKFKAATEAVTAQEKRLIELLTPEARGARHRSDVICDRFLCLPEDYPSHYVD